MNDVDPTLPQLRFETWSVVFPDRGQHFFLPSSDLRTPQPGADGSDPRRGVWFFRSASGSCGIVPGAVTVVRAKARVIGLAVLHDGEVIEIDGQRATFYEIRRVTVDAASRLLGRPCAFCQVSFQDGDPIVRCPLCSANYHADCWAELTDKRCCSRNCHFSPGPIGER